MATIERRTIPTGSGCTSLSSAGSVGPSIVKPQEEAEEAEAAGSQQRRSPSKVDELASQLPAPPGREPSILSFERRQRNSREAIEHGGAPQPQPEPQP